MPAFHFDFSTSRPYLSVATTSNSASFQPLYVVYVFIPRASRPSLSRNSAAVSSPLLCNGAFILSSYPPVSHRARCPILFCKSIVILLLPPFPRVYCKSVQFPVFVRLDSSRRSLCHSLPPNFLSQRRDVDLSIALLACPLTTSRSTRWLIYI